jgi:CRISPR type IV-associated protein Csf3
MVYRDKYDLEPLRIRAYLRAGVVSDKWLPLDGILLYQAHRDLLGPQDVTIPGDYTCQGVSTLPLGIVHPGRCNWYYQCSWAQWSHDVEGSDHWNKRFDSKFASLVDFGKKRGKVIIEQGKYKAYHVPIFYRAALWTEWYCVGDRKEIEHLLSTVTHIGKKGSQGWGRVAVWKIESVQEDWSAWRDGKLMRGIPPDDLKDKSQPFNLLFYGIRPSYWKKENQKPLAMPS